MTLRRARGEDAARVGDLMRQLGYDASESDIARRIERSDDDRTVVLAEDDTGTLGWAAVCVEESFVEGRQAWIEGFVVDEGSRGHGIGAQLLAAAETWARERGCATMRVQSNVLRERAHRFYDRHGYAKIKAQFAFRKPL